MEENDLIEAAKSGNYDKAVSLLSGGYSVHLRDKDNATPLYWSSCRGFPEICRELIKRKSDVDAQVKWGSTALHAACDRNHMECVRHLIKSGANLDIQNSRGDTALHLAAYRGNLEIVKLLIRAHANLFVKNDKGKTSAGEAEGNNHVETAQVIYRRMKELTTRSGGDGEHQVLSCPESLGPILREEILQSKSPLTGKNSGDFVRYNSNLTDFRCQNNPTYTSGKCVVIVDPEKKEGQDKYQYQSFRDNSQHGLKLRKCDPEAITRRQSVNGTDYSTRIRNRRLSPTESLDEQANGHFVETKSEQNVNGYHGDVKRPIDDVSSMSQNSTSVFDLSSCFSRREPYINNNCETRSANSRSNDGFARMREYAEMLQMNLVRSNDEISKKDAEIRALKEMLENTRRQMTQYQLLCRKFYDEKVESENRMKQIENEMNSRRGLLTQPSSENCRIDSVLLQPDYKDVHTFLKSVPQSTSDFPARALIDHVISKWLPHSSRTFCNARQNEKCQELCATCESSSGQSCLSDSKNEPEWIVGSAFVLTNAKPVHQIEVNGRFESMCFEINHKGNPFSLKVVVPKRDVSAHAVLPHPGISNGRPNIDMSEADYQKTTDYKLLTSCSHPNLISPVHHYTGSSDRFLKFFPSVTPDASVSTHSIPRACFLVFNKYPYTLKSFFHEHCGGMRGVSQDFVYSLLYQLLTAIDYLLRCGVSLCSLDPDRIYLDRRLCPVINVTDLGMGQTSDLTNTMTSTHSTWSVAASEKSVRMLGMSFYALLHLDQSTQNGQPRDQFQPMRDGPTHCTIHSPGLHFILREMTKFEASDSRVTVQKALLYVGMLMSPPISDTVTNEEDAALQCRARLLTLLATVRCDEPSETIFTPTQSVQWTRPQIEADFLSRGSAEGFWDIFQSLKQRNLL